MSILIPGMSLPKEGENRLALFVGSDGVVDVYSSVGEATPWLEHYVFECDAIELPPHGRLIDADALRCQWLEAEAKIGGDMRLDAMTVHDIITESCVFDLDNAPTIIPADTEKEDT